MTAESSIIADRYGRRDDPVRTRRILVIALVVFVLAASSFAAWVALGRQDGVTWIDRGVEVLADDVATVSFQVSLPPGAQAICQVRAVDRTRADVGRQDVVVGPSTTGVVDLTVRLRTTQRADGGGVRTCVLR